jgi:hypothetical protein
MTDLRPATYAARRALRSGNVDGYLRRNKRVDTPTVRRLCVIIEPLLTVHCIAKAETLAIETYLKEQTK